MCTLFYALSIKLVATEQKGKHSRFKNSAQATETTL